MESLLYAQPQRSQVSFPMVGLSAVKIEFGLSDLAGGGVSVMCSFLFIIHVIRRCGRHNLAWLKLEAIVGEFTLRYPREGTYRVPACGISMHTGVGNRRVFGEETTAGLSCLRTIWQRAEDFLAVKGRSSVVPGLVRQVKHPSTCRVMHDCWRIGPKILFRTDR